MAKPLTNRHKDAILKIIHAWDKDKIGWDLICDASSKVMGRLPTRQSLSSFPEIKRAYLAKKDQLKNHGPLIIKVDSLKSAGERIARQQSEIDLLTKTVNELTEQFVVWQYNAYKFGLKEHQLNEPLPVIDRKQTTKKT